MKGNSTIFLFVSAWLAALPALRGQALVPTDDLPAAREASAEVPADAARVVEITPNGEAHVDGGSVDAKGLAAAFESVSKDGRDRTAKLPAGGEMQLCDRDVVLRIASGASSIAVDRCLDLLASAHLPRAWLVVKSRGSERAFELTLPDPGARPAQSSRVKFAADTERMPTGPIYGALRDAVRDGTTSLRVDVEPATTVDDLVELFDIARRAGIETWAVHGIMTRAQMRAWTTGGLTALAQTTLPKADTGRQFEGIATNGPSDDRLLAVAVAEARQRAQAKAAAEAAKAAALEPEGENDGQQRPRFDPSQWNSAVGLGGGAGGIYGGRGGGRRRLGRGSAKRIGAAIEGGLEWLRAHQRESGAFGDTSDDLHATALALLAILSDGSTMRSGLHKDMVRSAVTWLRAQQQEDGRFGQSETTRVETHALTTLAMIEAFGLSAYSPLKAPSQRALNHLVGLRGEDHSWLSADGASPPAAVWCVEAWRSGRHFKLEVDENAASPTVSSLLELATGSEAPSGTVEAALFCAFLAGDKASETVKAALAELAPRVVARLPAAEDPELTRWLNGSYGLYQTGGAAWKRWQNSMTEAVLALRAEDGSWPPPNTGGSGRGRTETTALMCITLQVYHRYTRLMR